MKTLLLIIVGAVTTLGILFLASNQPIYSLICYQNATFFLLIAGEVR